MRLRDGGLWIHLALILLLVPALLAGGCEEEEDTAQPTVSPTESAEPTAAPTETDGASPTASPTPTDVSDEPPPLPPSFQLDFDAFTSAGETALLGPDMRLGMQYSMIGLPLGAATAALGDQSNWGYAAFNVGVWSAIAIVGTAIPAAAFVASFHNIPVRQPDGSWLWSYTVPISGTYYTAELYGSYVDEGVKWDMYISKENGYQDFNWFYGISDGQATEGYWIVKEKPSKPNDFVRIDWENNAVEGTGMLKYTNIIPNHKENGGYISFTATNDTPYNRFFDIYNKGEDNHTYIEWNDPGEQGRVKDIKHFKDDKWHCWDGNHNNIQCP